MSLPKSGVELADPMNVGDKWAWCALRLLAACNLASHLRDLLPGSLNFFMGRFSGSFGFSAPLVGCARVCNSLSVGIFGFALSFGFAFVLGFALQHFGGSKLWVH